MEFPLALSAKRAQALKDYAAQKGECNFSDRMSQGTFNEVTLTLWSFVGSNPLHEIMWDSQKTCFDRTAVNGCRSPV